MFYTTLNAIRDCNPCTNGWKKLLRALGKTQADDAPLSFLTILESVGLKRAIWCLRALPAETPEVRLFSIRCVREVQHLMKDERALHALDVAERYTVGEATSEDLEEAYAASYDAACATVCTTVCATACLTACAARAALYGYAETAAGDSAFAARADAYTYAHAYAYTAARAVQEADFRAIFCS